MSHQCQCFCRQLSVVNRGVLMSRVRSPHPHIRYTPHCSSTLYLLCCARVSPSVASKMVPFQQFGGMIRCSSTSVERVFAVSLIKGTGEKFIWGEYSLQRFFFFFFCLLRSEHAWSENRCKLFSWMSAGAGRRHTGEGCDKCHVDRPICLIAHACYM